MEAENVTRETESVPQTQLNQSTQTSKLGPTRISKSEIDKKAAEAKEARAYPPIPGNSIKENELQNWISILPEAAWNRLDFYIYRVTPVINRKLSDPDNKNYIDILTREVLQTSGNGDIHRYLKALHGGGTYKVMINDTDKRTNQNIMTAYCQVNYDEADPILNYRELVVEEPKNISYVQTLINRGILDQQKRLIVTSSPQSQQNQIPSANDSATINLVSNTIDKMFTMFSQMNREQKNEAGKMGFNEIFLEKMRQEDPNKQFQMLDSMMTRFIGIINNRPEPPKPEFSMKDILEMQEKNNMRVMELFGKLLEKKEKDTEEKEVPQEDFLDKLMKYRTAFPELFGGKGRQPEKSSGELIMEGVRELALPLLGIGSQFLQMKTGIKPVIPVTPQQAQEMVGQVQPQLNAPNSGPPNPNVVSIDQGASVLNQMISAYGMVVVNALKSGMSGIDAGIQIKQLAPMIGQDVYEVIKSQGQEKILAAMKANQEFWNQTGVIYGEEKMEIFVDEFCRFEEIITSEG